MRKELWQRLTKDFPFMKPNPEPTASADLFAGLFSDNEVEHGDGWYPLLHAMAQEIADAYAKENLSPDFKLIKTTESYGRLCVRYGFTQDESTIDTIHSVVKEIIQGCEDLSEHYCERCGRRGKHSSLGTRCKRCREFELTGLCGPLTPEIFTDNKICSCSSMGTADGFEFYGGCFKVYGNNQFIVFVKKDSTLVAEAEPWVRGLKINRTSLTESDTSLVLSAWESLNCNQLANVNIKDIQQFYNVPLEEITALVKK